MSNIEQKHTNFEKDKPMKHLITLLFCFLFLGAIAQEKTNIQFLSAELNSGVIHSQLAILNNGLKVGYGIETSERFILSTQLGFNFAKSIENDPRDCRLLLYSLGGDIKIPMYDIVTKTQKMQTYISGGLSYSFSNVCSKIYDEPCGKLNDHFMTFRFGGAVELPRNKNLQFKYPFLRHSNFLIHLHQVGYVNNNVSSFYKEYSKIGKVTWSQELTLLFIYQFK